MRKCDAFHTTLPSRNRIACGVSARRSDRLRPSGRVPGGCRGRRSPGGDSCPGNPHRRGDVSDEHPEHPQRLRGGASARSATSCLGVERDDPRATVRAGAAGVRADRRGASGVSRVELRTLEAARRRAWPSAVPVVRHAVRRASLLEHHGAEGLREVSFLLE